MDEVKSGGRQLSCVVTGATGCIGRNLVEVLLKDDWKITVLHRKSSNLTRLANCNVSFKEVNLYDYDSVNQAIEFNTDAIFHCAANVSHWSKDAAIQWKDNVLATRNLANVALEKNASRFIFTSTGATCKNQHDDEERGNKVKMGYIRTKRLSELELSKAVEKGLYAIIMKPTIAIGKYDYNNYSQIFKDVQKGPFSFSLPGRFAFCHAKDVARAHVQAFYKGRNRESYILGGSYATWDDVFRKIAVLL